MNSAEPTGDVMLKNDVKILTRMFYYSRDIAPDLVGRFCAGGKVKIAQLCAIKLKKH